MFSNSCPRDTDSQTDCHILCIFDPTICQPSHTRCITRPYYSHRKYDELACSLLSGNTASTVHYKTDKPTITACSIDIQRKKPSHHTSYHSSDVT